MLVGWRSVLRGLLHSLRARLTGSEHPPPLHPTGGRLGLPADFLIAGDGTVLACKYGTHAYDQWSVDELLAHRRRGPRLTPTALPVSPAPTSAGRPCRGDRSRSAY